MPNTDHPTSDNPLVAFLDRAAAARGWTREELSRRAGMSRGAVRSIEARGPQAGVNFATIKAYADALEIDPSELIAVMPSKHAPERRIIQLSEKQVAPTSLALPRLGARDLPVRGTAAGSALGAFQITTDVVDYAPRPPSLQSTKDAYALFVQNDSMIPRHWPGDLVYVHPHRPLAVFDSMIIQVKTAPNAEFESYIKTYKGRDADWIHAEQYNPSSTLKYKRETVVLTHKVLTLNELLGV